MPVFCKKLDQMGKMVKSSIFWKPIFWPFLAKNAFFDQKWPQNDQKSKKFKNSKNKFSSYSKMPVFCKKLDQMGKMVKSSIFLKPIFWPFLVKNAFFGQKWPGLGEAKIDNFGKFFQNLKFQVKN